MSTISYRFIEHFYSQSEYKSYLRQIYGTVVHCHFFFVALAVGTTSYRILRGFQCFNKHCFSYTNLWTKIHCLLDLASLRSAP
jgi:hypothetical protein